MYPITANNARDEKPCKPGCMTNKTPRNPNKIKNHWTNKTFCFKNNEPPRDTRIGVICSIAEEIDKET